MTWNNEKMGLRDSILFFGIPGILMWAGVRFLVPLADSWGWPFIVSYPLFVWAPVVVLLFAILVCRMGDHDRTTFSERFRFKPINRNTWLLAVGGFVLVQALELLVAPTRRWLAEVPVFAPPELTPQLFHPFFAIEEGLTQLFGVPLEGNWWLVGFWLLWLLINIGGEEILWRGYALPMQEKVFGRSAWLVNGLLWNFLVHAFMPWGYLTLLPVSLILPYLVQRTGNTWVGVIIHGVGNLLVLLVLIPAISST